MSIISRNGQDDDDESDDDEYGQFDDYGPRAVDEPEGQYYLSNFIRNDVICLALN